MIDTQTFIEIVNSVEGMEIEEIGKSQHDELIDRMNKVDEMRARSEIHKLLKDNNISLN